MNTPIYLFSAHFETGKEADEFVSEQWLPEPDDVDSPEYEEWEKINPIWKLQEELEFYMYPDFIEPAYDIEYIKTMIDDEKEKKHFEESIPKGHNFFIIMGTEAIWADKRIPKSKNPIREPEDTKTLKYLGKYN